MEDQTTIRKTSKGEVMLGMFLQILTETNMATAQNFIIFIKKREQAVTAQSV